jgi:hypothetical protein
VDRVARNSENSQFRKDFNRRNLIRNEEVYNSVARDQLLFMARGCRQTTRRAATKGMER